MLQCFCTNVFAESCDGYAENASKELTICKNNVSKCDYFQNDICKSLVPLEKCKNAKISKCCSQSTQAMLTFSLLKSESSYNDLNDDVSSGSSVEIGAELTTEDGLESTTQEGNSSPNGSEDLTLSPDATETTTQDGNSSENATETTTSAGSTSDNATETTTNDDGDSSNRSSGGGNSSKKAEKRNDVPKEPSDDSSSQPKEGTENTEINSENPDTEEIIEKSNDNDIINNGEDDDKSDDSVNITKNDDKDMLPDEESIASMPVETNETIVENDNVDTVKNNTTTLPQTGSPFGTSEITLLGIAFILLGAYILLAKRARQ